MCSFNLSSLFLFFGFDFKRRDNPWIRSLLHVLKLKSIAIFIYYVYDYTESLCNTSDITKRQLSSITMTIKCYLTLISFMVFISKFPRIFAIEKKIRRNLSNKSLKRSSYFDKVLILVLFILIIINIAGKLIVMLLNSSEMSIMDILLWQFNNLSWLLLVQLSLFKFIYEIHLIEQDTFQLDQNFFFDRKMNRQNLQAKLELLISLKHSVNTDLGLLVFLYLGSLFQSTCFKLSFLTVNTSLDQAHVLLLLVEFTSHVIVSLAMIYLVNYCQSKRPSQVDMLKMISNSPSEQPNSLSLTFDFFDFKMINIIIKKYCKLDYSPCYMFDIKHKFILYYFSTVITFTVMLATIIEQFLK